MATDKKVMETPPLHSTAPEIDYRAAFKKWLDGVAEKLKDATALDVSTFSGDIKGIFDVDGESFKFNVNKFKTAMEGNTVALIAHTHQEIDHDTLLFVKSNLTEQEQKLVASHNEAAEAAAASRAAFIKLLTNL